MPLHRYMSPIGVSGRKLSNTMRIFFSAVNLLWVIRLISRISYFVYCVLASICQNRSDISWVNSLLVYPILYFYHGIGVSLKVSITLCLWFVPVFLDDLHLLFNHNEFPWLWVKAWRSPALPRKFSTRLLQHFAKEHTILITIIEEVQSELKEGQDRISNTMEIVNNEVEGFTTTLPWFKLNLCLMPLRHSQ